MFNTENIENQLSEYEIIRKRNIERNEDFLKSIGIDVNRNLNPTQSLQNEEPIFKKPKKKSNHKVIIPTETSSDSSPVRRRSSRLDPNLQSNKSNNTDEDHSAQRIKQSKRVHRETYSPSVDDGEERKPITEAELQQFILETNKEHYDIISNEAIHHCIMRLRSMSNKALLTRLKRIVIFEKLLVFYYALVLSELKDLADVAAYFLLNNFKVTVKNNL